MSYYHLNVSKVMVNVFTNDFCLMALYCLFYHCCSYIICIFVSAMVYHVPYYLEKYRYLHDIGVAQVERKNFDHRQAYFGSTNRNGGRHREKVSMQVGFHLVKLLPYL